VEPIARKIKAYFFKFPSVKKVDIAGSFRRKKGTIGDLDVLIVSNDVQKIMDAFTSMKDVTKIINKGMKKSAVRLKNGLQVDLRVVKGKEWGAAFLYFTGNKQHNVLLRKIALKKGMTLNEYRLATKEGEWVAGKTEHSIYRALGLTYVKPEKRFGKKEA
jgi:DNA polymerase (family 10)